MRFSTLAVVGGLLAVLILTTGRVCVASAPSSAERAAKLLSAGDSAGAMAGLEKELEGGSRDYPAFLLRGQLRLAQGRNREAELDFRRVLYSESDCLRALAHMGLGDVFRVTVARRWDAVGEYRLALAADSTNLEALYAIAGTAFEIGWTDGYMTADEALAKLICLEPEYKDALSQWWDRIYIQSDEELRRVCGCLQDYIVLHPGRCNLRFYVPGILFRVGQYAQAVAALDSLDAACPGFKPAECSLLRAECTLELGDSLGFERDYYRALQRAEHENDFTRIFQEAETIFSPEDDTRWAACNTPRLKADFFRGFWERRDPDPFSPYNERLVEHYRRLHRARKFYYDRTPHSFRQTSRTYDNLLSLTPQYTDTSRHYDFKYKPGLWWERGRELALEQRGLFYIRHGEPDFLYKTGLPWDEGSVESLYDIKVNNGGLGTLLASQSGPPRATRGIAGLFEVEKAKPDPVPHAGVPKRDTDMDGTSDRKEGPEAWRYGPAYFLFKKYSGRYDPSPVTYGDAGDITRAMQSESFRDPLDAFRQDIFAVDFKDGAGRLELLFFQSAPQDSVGKANAPFSDLALFDSTWTRLVARDSSIAWPLILGPDSLWLAANRATVAPGKYNFVHRLDVPNRRAVLKKQSVSLPPYPVNRFWLSGILLGSHPERGQGLFERYGAEINPRPSLRFAPGEKIAVYLEAYGLVPSRKGSRAFRERVTVTRDEKKSPLVKLLPFAFRNRKKSLSMTFERSPQAVSPAVPETFDLDTAPLMPGVYALSVEITDRGSGIRCTRGCSFEINEP